MESTYVQTILSPKRPSTQLSYALKSSNLHNYYPKPEYLIIVSFGPLGENMALRQVVQ